MKRLLWTAMIAVSGFFVGLATFSFVIQRANEFTTYFLILGLVLGAIGYWGYSKYVGKRSVYEK